MLLLESILAEKKILFTSKHIALLTLCAESVISLMYPLSWQHIFIPVLPSQLIGYLQAPVPFIVGVQGSVSNIPDDVPAFFHFTIDCFSGSGQGTSDHEAK